MSKVSIRFFNDKEVRAVWNEQESKWFFSVLDIVGVLNNQEDYEKNRNYWKYLKAKLKKEGNQLHQMEKNALTDKINDREMFMKGIDYSYYYEEIDNNV